MNSLLPLCIRSYTVIGFLTCRVSFSDRSSRVLRMKKSLKFKFVAVFNSNSTKDQRSLSGISCVSLYVTDVNDLNWVKLESAVKSHITNRPLICYLVGLCGSDYVCIL